MNDVKTQTNAGSLEYLQTLLRVTQQALQETQELLRKQTERSAAGAQFIDELLDSCESLTDIAQEHGANTLADLLYLHQAIVDGCGSVECIQGDSAVLQVVAELPSAHRWLQFLKVHQ